MMRILAFVVVALVASLAQAQTRTHTWEVTDSTEASSEMSVPVGRNPAVSCGANTALRVRCSSATTWQRFSSDTSLIRLSCGPTNSLHYSEAGDDDNYATYGWPCADNQVTKVGVSHIRHVVAVP